MGLYELQMQVWPEPHWPFVAQGAPLMLQLPSPFVQASRVDGWAIRAGTSRELKARQRKR
jgi:hypothetical protein